MTTKTNAGLDFIKVNAPEAYQRLIDVEAAALAAQATASAAVPVSTILAAPVDAVAGSTTLTSNNTQVSDTDPVTIDTKTYTFKTSLTPTEGEVLIGADADASLLNLIRAINHTGTPNTDYKCAAAHPTVAAAASVTSHTFVITALVKGTAGNAIATTEVAATLSFTGLVLAGGIDGTVGAAGQIAIYSTQPYICLSAATVATSGAWKKLTVASL